MRGPLTSPASSPFGALVRALALTAGRAALQRALPFYMGVSLLAAIVF